MKKLLVTTTAILAATGAFAQEITVGAANVPKFLDPGRDHSNTGSQFYYNALDTLVGHDPHTIEQIWKPALATEWKLVEPKVMEFKLRKDVTFHNGEEMTADDVVFSLNRIYQATFPPYLVRSKDRLSNFVEATKVDDYTVRVRVEREEPLWETLMNLQQVMIIPEDYTKALSGDPDVAEDGDYEAFSLAPVGTGPYAISEFVPGEKVIYTRFDDFWGEKAPLEKASVIRMPETSARITALKTGEADIITNIAPDQLALIENDADLKTEGSATALFHVMIMNVNHPKLTDPKLRQALSLAIDRDLLNEALWLGKAIVPSSHTMVEMGDLHQPDLKTFEYDPEKAKALLAESNYDGEEIIFDAYPVYYTNGVLAGQAIIEMWSEIGVKGKLRVSAKWNGNDPEMMTRSWSNPMYFADPFGSFGVMWAPDGASESGGRFNTDAEYAAIWDEFRFSSDVAVRNAAYAKLMDRIKADPPVLPLYRPFESWAMQKSVNWKPLPGHIPYVLDFRAGSISLTDR
ncbi:ABC transporter substrate-binding protein [Pikeienuella piscinae]|uniref:ABC transporter substrate-binding protein n=1 Tax=Pikeienuella piscinae TaxID=2748098 RepID=A0A7L5BW41_9RHOB|nr:ABC transporter substrate-binding protein [Pikeienuella piscinae]QIE55651.1 ABC transporter substrate-binding protein [Pikeienuella piscinae]